MQTAEARNDLHFDIHQFVRRPKAVSSTTGISWDDFDKSMTIHRLRVQRQRRLATPQWAVNDDTLRAKVLDHLERRFFLWQDDSLTDSQRLLRIDAEAKRRLPSMRANLERLMQRYATEDRSGNSEQYFSRLAIEVQNLDTQIVLHQRGIAAVMCAALYKYFRLGWTSAQIANDSNGAVKAPAIRIWCFRLRGGYAKRNPLVARVRWPQQKLRDFFLMRSSGLTLRQCAAKLNVHPTSAARQWRLVFNDLNIKSRREYGLDPDFVAKAVRVLGTQRRAAQFIGVSAPVIRYWLNKQ